MKEAVKPGYGSLPKRGIRVVLEHTSANPNGPLHVGHIRNSIIGDTLARVFRKAGYGLEVQYYVNDMGRQIAIVVWGFDNLDSAHPGGGKRGCPYRPGVYRCQPGDREGPFHNPAGKYPDAARGANGDPPTVKKFRNEVSRCLDGFAVTMKNLNVDT